MAPSKNQYWLLNTKIVLIHAEIRGTKFKILVLGLGWEYAWLRREGSGEYGAWA